MQSNSTVTLKQDCIPDTVCDNFGKGADSGPTLPAWQAWYKPLGPNSAAIFVVNHAATPVSITINLNQYPSSRSKPHHMNLDASQHHQQHRHHHHYQPLNYNSDPPNSIATSSRQSHDQLPVPALTATYSNGAPISHNKATINRREVRPFSFKTTIIRIGNEATQLETKQRNNKTTIADRSKLPPSKSATTATKQRDCRSFKRL